MIKAQKEGPGLATGGQPYQHNPTGTTQEPVPRPTLAQAGIDKKLSSTSQAIASIPEEDFVGGVVCSVVVSSVGCTSLGSGLL